MTTVNGNRAAVEAAARAVCVAYRDGGDVSGAIDALYRATHDADPDATSVIEFCRDCDGCGWVEGGKTLQTNCATCHGTGLLV